MAYQHHLNTNSRKITLHKVSCRQWQKHNGTGFHKHGEINSFYLSYDNFHIDDYAIAKNLGTQIAKMERYKYHECSFCCRN